MNWNRAFSERTQSMKRSAVRELLKLTAQPEMISFAGGLPAPELFPVEEIKAATATVWETRAASALQYGQTEGLAELRDWVAESHSRPGLSLGRENVLIVSGSQQGLDLIGRILLDEGDEVAVENPSYLAMFSAWRPSKPRFAPVPSDAAGMVVEELAARQDRAPKLLYINPDFQNPQGTTLGRERRKILAALARERGIAVAEDNPYTALRYEGDPLPSLLHLNASARADGGFGSEVIQLGSFSKVLAPGLRVGWVIAEETVIDKLVLAKQACDLHTCTLSQHVALEVARAGVLDRQIPRLCSAYRERRDAMLNALETCLAGTMTWTRPEGGMFLMARLPEGMDANEVLRQALRQKVAFVPGQDFHCDGRGQNTLRLNFSCAQPALIAEGIARLAKVIAQLS